MSHWQCFLHGRPDVGLGHGGRLGHREAGVVVPDLDDVTEEDVPAVLRHPVEAVEGAASPRVRLELMQEGSQR